jgi:hypothetical protein
MPGKWLPPHLRGKAGRPEGPSKGVRFPSNATGEPSENVRFKKAPTQFRNGNQTRSAKYTGLSRSLATRKVRNKPLKSALKRKPTTIRRRTI